MRSARIGGLLRGEPNTTLDMVRAHRRNWQVNRGAQIAADIVDFNDIVDEPATAAARPWRPDPTNAAYIDRLLCLAHQYDIDVFWMLPTISPAWQIHRENNGLDADYERYVRQVLARHPNLVIVDGRDSGYDRTAFRDAFHLQRRAPRPSAPTSGRSSRDPVPPRSPMRRIAG